MPKVMGKQGLGRRRRVNEEIASAWVEVAGEELASRTRVRGIRRGILTIEVESSSLCHDLAAFKKDALLVALKEKVRKSEITALRFRAGTLS